MSKLQFSTKYGIDLDDLAYAVRTIANTHPDTTWNFGEEHPGTDENPEGCIIGAALKLVGVSEQDLIQVEGNKAARAISHLLGIDEELVDLEWFDDVQQYQDAGETWGYAVDTADML